jgi:hypothetical protein
MLDIMHCISVDEAVSTQLIFIHIYLHTYIHQLSGRCMHIMHRLQGTGQTIHRNGLFLLPQTCREKLCSCTFTNALVLTIKPFVCEPTVSM